ncbi:MAG TPA: carboxymuconolactone decarboxylase family protein [Mycobacteriales bacterium]|nr:carboxymuconolactone decarboxylase family protein [Mycobacteriales bacterium]
MKIRASQVNSCAHCLEEHTQDVRALGESDDRMHLIAAWRETPCSTSRERAALAWCVGKPRHPHGFGSVAARLARGAEMPILVVP